MLWRRLLLLAAFLLPVVYLGLLFATMVHEVLGHGLVALLVGGRFDGFELYWDGMGRAYTYVLPGASLGRMVAVLAGGVVATTATGAILLAAATVRRLPMAAQFICLIMGLCCLLEGPPYILWNAYHPKPPGDIARILLLLAGGGAGHITALRWILVCLGGVICLLATALAMAMLLRRIEGWLRPDGTIGAGQRLVVLLLVASAGSAAWLLFDWNQLAPGIGVLPQVVGIAMFWLVGLVLYLRPKKPLPQEMRIGTLVICTLGAWVATGVVLLATMSILSDGIMWHDTSSNIR